VKTHRLFELALALALLLLASGGAAVPSSLGRGYTRHVAEIIPSDRLPPPGTWESAGVEGGIPDRQVICADVTQPPYSADNTGAVSAVAALQSAIDDCPAGQVVYVPEGTYLIDGPLLINQKSITLRGAGAATVFEATASLSIGRLSPWPPPKAQPAYYMPITGGAMRGSTTVTVADASSIPVGKMIMIDEVDDPALVWTKNGMVGRFRGSMHMVESKTATSVTFRPPLPIDYVNAPQLSRHPDLTEYAGVEDIHFHGNGSEPGRFITVVSAWNVWITGCEFSNMPAKTIFAGWVGHLEIRKNYLHDQANGGPNSEGIDLANDVNWSLVVDNICVAAGYPQINIGDMGANPYYSGGFGNVLAYNYCVDSFYTDPPTSTNHGMMTIDIGTNHSPHPQYNLVEGNIMGKFGVDSYHGSGSHTVLLRNVITGRNNWTYASNRIAVQIDRRNLYYSLIGNVLGEVGNPTTYEYVATSGLPGWTESTIYRLGYPNVGNVSFSGEFPPTPLYHGDGGPRDLYVDRDDTAYGTTLIEGNWNPISGQDWTTAPEPIPESYYLVSKPSWFGALAWPPMDPANPNTDDPTIIPAGYRYVHGTDPAPALALRGVPGDETIYLNWTVEDSTLPVTSTWHIDYYTTTLTAPFTATSPLSTARAYTLTGLTNYEWYTVTLSAMVDTTAVLSDTVSVMPTDLFVYLPIAMKED
jgi:hypothetical protein